jgi:outer membrane protein TolC
MPPVPLGQTDDRPGDGGAMTETLEDAWRIALANDQQIEASQWNVSAANHTYAATSAERFPSVNVGADYFALSDQPSFSIKVPSLPTLQLPILDQTSGGFHALVTQPLYTSGRISSGMNAAAASAEANQADARTTRLDVKMNVAEIYILVLRAARLVDVAESRVTSLRDHARVVADYHEKGTVAKNDVLSAQVALADAQQQALETSSSLEVARAAYNRALGRQLTDPVRLAEIRDDGEACDIAELTRMACETRPEIAKLSAQANALRWEADSVQAKSGPQAGLIGGYVYQQDRYVDPNGVAVLAVGVEWNVFDSGRVRNQANSIRDKAESVVHQRMDAESKIALDVRQKWLQLQTARQRVQVARQVTAQADENLRVARDRYQQQVGTNTEVLDAEVLRVQAYTNFYNSSCQAILAGLHLRRAVGNL